MFLGMIEAGMVQLIKLFLRNVKKTFFEAFLGKGRTAFTMFAIVTVIFTLAIVKESEQPHDSHIGTSNGCEKQAVEFHLPPMRKSMNRRIYDSIAIDKLL